MPEFIGSSMNLKIRLVYYIDIFLREELGNVFWMVLKLLHTYLGASSKKAKRKTWQMSLVAEEQRTKSVRAAWIHGCSLHSANFSSRRASMSAQNNA